MIVSEAIWPLVSSKKWNTTQRSRQNDAFTHVRMWGEDFINRPRKPYKSLRASRLAPETAGGDWHVGIPT
jgi:hypothetical protein